MEGIQQETSATSEQEQRQQRHANGDRGVRVPHHHEQHANRQPIVWQAAGGAAWCT